MRIALLGPTYPYRGGIAHHTTLLSQYLANRHDLLFISFKRQYPKCLFPGKSDKDPSDKGPRASDVAYLLDSLNPLSWVKTALRIVHYKPDVLVMPWWVVFWAPQYVVLTFLVRHLSKAKLIFICHNVVEHESAVWKRLATSLVLSRGDILITQSGAESERLKTMFTSKHTVITGFHPTYAALVDTIPEQWQARQALGISGPVLLFFGFVRPYKGLDVLLDAVPKINAECPITVLVVGEFWKDKKRYLEQITRLHLQDIVHIKDGYVPNEEIGNYFAACDLVVQPYHSVTGSGVAQLAYGLKKPVIASRVGNMSEIIESGVNGMLVAPGDPDALARAVIEALDENKLSILTKGAERTKEKYSWDRFCLLLEKAVSR